MKTRRSPKNQERLWKHLTPPTPEKPQAEMIPPKTDAEIDAMFWIPKNSRTLMKADAAKQRSKKT